MICNERDDVRLIVDDEHEFTARRNRIHDLKLEDNVERVNLPDCHDWATIACLAGQLARRYLAGTQSFVSPS
jgi:hypothetical protein